MIHKNEVPFGLRSIIRKAVMDKPAKKDFAATTNNGKKHSWVQTVSIDSKSILGKSKLGH